MGMAPSDFYKAYIRSERWKRKRQQAFAYHGKRCYACRKSPQVLHVHHLTYDRVGRENMSDLMILCVPCHKEVTRLSRLPGARQRGILRVTMEYVRRVQAARNR